MRKTLKAHNRTVRTWMAAIALFTAFGAPRLGHAQSVGLAPTLTAFHASAHRWTAVSTPERVRAGEPMLFVINYENHAPSAVPIGDLYFAVPSDVALTEIAEPTEAVVSVDGGRTFDQLDHLTVARNGVIAPAELGDVTHVKWRLSHRIQPGEEGSLSARGVRQ